MTDTPIGDAVEQELFTDPEAAGETADADLTDEATDDDEAGELAPDDQLPDPGPGEADDDGTAEETGSVIDDDEDPGTPLPDDPFGPEYATISGP